MANVRDFPADERVDRIAVKTSLDLGEFEWVAPEEYVDTERGDRIAVKTGLGLGEFEWMSLEEYVATIRPEKLPKAGITEERVREIVREIVREMVCRFAIRNSAERENYKREQDGEA